MSSNYRPSFYNDRHNFFADYRVHAVPWGGAQSSIDVADIYVRDVWHAFWYPSCGRCIGIGSIVLFQSF